MDLRKVDGAENPADLLTKHSLSRGKFLDLVKLYDCQYREGRAESAPQLRTSRSSKTTMASGTCDGAIAPVSSANVEAAGQEQYSATAAAAVVNDAFLSGGLKLEGQEEIEEETTPWMPHLALTADELDRRFPTLVAPDDEDPEDITKDTEDHMLQYGIKIANEISEGMLRHGRTRRDCLDGSLRR